MSVLSPCPLQTALSVISGKWKPIILWIIRDETKRFGEIRREIPPITQKMLTQHLRELEQDGIVRRRVHPIVPPKVEYSLTKYGRTLRPVLDAIADWGSMHQHVLRDEARSGKAVQRRFPELPSQISAFPNHP